MSTGTLSNLSQNAALWRDGGYAAQLAKKEDKKLPFASLKSVYKKVWALESLAKKAKGKVPYRPGPPTTKIAELTINWVVNGAVAVVPIVAPEVGLLADVPGPNDSSRVHFDHIDFKVMIKPGHVVDVEHVKLLSALLVEEQFLGEALLRECIDNAEKVLGEKRKISWLPSLYRAGMRAAFRDATEAFILKKGWLEFEIYLDENGQAAGLDLMSAKILREFFYITNNPNAAELGMLHRMLNIHNSTSFVCQYQRNRDMKMLPAYIMWNVDPETLYRAEMLVNPPPK